MFGASINSRVRAAARRFVRADQGNIAVMFAIALVPIISFIGAAVDYSRANRARSSMQAALDSTALMLSKDLTSGVISASDIDTKAGLYFKALYTDNEATINAGNIHGTYTAKDASGASTVVVTGSGSIDTQFMKVAGFPQLNFDSNSTAKWGNVRMRVALVLDVTGSMASDSKMPNLQSAANSMIDTLSGLSKTAGDLYISVVPFAKDVNVGVVNPSPSWSTGWAAWKAEPAAIVPPATKIKNWTNYGPGATCPFGNQNFGCASTPVSGSAETNTIPSSGSYSGYICPAVDNGTSNYYNGCYDSKDLGTTTDVTLCTGKNCSCNNAAIGGTGSGTCTCTGNKSNTSCTQTLRNYSHTWIPNDQTTWNGCVIDRDQNNDVSNTAPTLGDTTTQFYVEQWSACPSVAIAPMTDAWSTLKTNVINKLTPNGNTNQAIGLAWGWLTLGQNVPEIKAPDKPTGYAYQDYIVLVSDGLNTQDRWYSDAASIDARQALLCTAIKGAGIKIFTLQINTGIGTKADPESAILKSCASDGNFQMITSASQTASAFQNITTKLSQLRLAK